MDRALRPVLPPLLRPAAAAAAVLVAASLFMVLGSHTGPLRAAALDPWQASCHAVALAIFVLILDDARRCRRWLLQARDVGPGADAWAGRALRLFEARVSPADDSARPLDELQRLHDELSRRLTERWAVRYMILACVPTLLGFVAGLLSLNSAREPVGSFFEVFRPTLAGSAETLLAGGIAYVLRVKWEEVLDTWYDAAAAQLAPVAPEPEEEAAAPPPSPAPADPGPLSPSA
jgi:hypothetical protein